LTMYSSHLDAVVRGKVASDTNPATDLVHDISTAIQDGAAADKHARIADVDAESGADAESVRRSVSAFYLTIAKVLSAISLAIQPENEPPADPAETDNLFSPDFKMSRMSFCGTRIQRFAKEVTANGANGADDSNASDRVAEINTLDDYFGIPELYDLYFDADYDMETGAFLGMTDETRTTFNRDLGRFYKAFSGEEVVPDHIKRFSDIPLRLSNDDPNRSEPDAPRPLFVCKFNDDEVDCSPLIVNVVNPDNSASAALKAELITQFAEHLQKMIRSVVTKRRQLIDLVNQMFVYGTKKTGEERDRHPRVRAYLTMKALTTIASDAQRIIADMSLQCEVDNRTGDQLFSAMHAIQLLESNEAQINVMKHELELLEHT
jgi:hypothetical protein